VEALDFGTSSVTWSILHNGDGVPPLPNQFDTVTLATLKSALEVTNMATLTLDSQQASLLLGQLPPMGSFDAASATVDWIDTATVRGGRAGQGAEGWWVYSPNDTYNKEAPWDPDHPFGNDPQDGSRGGASFLAQLGDANGNKLQITVTPPCQ